MQYTTLMLTRRSERTSQLGSIVCTLIWQIVIGVWKTFIAMMRLLILNRVKPFLKIYFSAVNLFSPVLASLSQGVIVCLLYCWVHFFIALWRFAYCFSFFYGFFLSILAFVTCHLSLCVIAFSLRVHRHRLSWHVDNSFLCLAFIIISFAFRVRCSSWILSSCKNTSACLFNISKALQDFYHFAYPLFACEIIIGICILFTLAWYLLLYNQFFNSSVISIVGVVFIFIALCRSSILSYYLFHI